MDNLTELRARMNYFKPISREINHYLLTYMTMYNNMYIFQKDKNQI